MRFVVAIILGIFIPIYYNVIRTGNAKQREERNARDKLIIGVLSIVLIILIYLVYLAWTNE